MTVNSVDFNELESSIKWHAHERLMAELDERSRHTSIDPSAKISQFQAEQDVAHAHYLRRQAEETQRVNAIRVKTRATPNYQPLGPAARAAMWPIVDDLSAEGFERHRQRECHPGVEHFFSPDTGRYVGTRANIREATSEALVATLVCVREGHAGVDLGCIRWSKDWAVLYDG